MPRTRASSSSQANSPSVGVSDDFAQPFIHNEESDDIMVHFPFKFFDECQDCHGKGYVKTSILPHINDRHWASLKDKAVCKERICTNVVYAAWEKLLN